MIRASLPYIAICTLLGVIVWAASTYGSIVVLVVGIWSFLIWVFIRGWSRLP